MRIFLILVIVFYGNQLNAQQKNIDFVYSIVFASCFQDDSVELKVNDVRVITEKRITTDFSSGISSLVVYQDSNGLWLVYNKDKAKQPAIEVNDRLLLDIMVNGQWTTLTAELKKGKTLFINHCFVKDKEERKQKLTLTQYKDTVQLY